MKLYRSLARIWTGTQADAKAAQGGNDYETIEVPTDKPSLIAWLNEFDVRPGDQPAETVTIATADIRDDKDGAPSISHDVPATPEPVMREAQMQRFEALARKLGWSPPGETPAPTAAPRRDLTTEILALDEQALPQVVSVAIGRLGELAGTHGWAAFAKNTYAWTPAARSVEQGLGMLFLAALDQIGENSQSSDKPSA